MLKNLYKYEFKWMLGKTLIIWIVVVGLAIIGRLCELFTEIFSEAIAQSNLLTSISVAAISSTTLLFIFSVFLSFTLCLIASAIRFYKNLYSCEGYFTLCTPIMPKDHVICKFLVTFACLAMTAIVCFIAIVIRQAGTGLDITGRIISILASIMKKPQGWLYMTEAVLCVLACLAFMIMEGYLAVSFGQAFKNRVSGAIGCYFLISFALQLAISIVSAIYFFIGLLLIRATDTVFIHVTLWLVFMLASGLFLGGAAIVIKRLTYKVNLE